MVSKYFANGHTHLSSTYFITKDHIGSVREILSNAGAIQNTTGYCPFGRLVSDGSASTSDYFFAEYFRHKRSGLNLSYSRAYNSALARWLNRDPADESDNTNLFAYVSNEPINSVDPSGQGVVKVTMCAILAYLCFKEKSDGACRLFTSLCAKGCRKPSPKQIPKTSTPQEQLDKYWRNPHPTQGPPNSIHRRYHPNGDIKSVQTYDEFGRRHTRYDLRDSMGKPEHRHNWTKTPGSESAKEHLPLETPHPEQQF